MTGLSGTQVILGRRSRPRTAQRKSCEAVGAEDWRVVGEGASAYFRTGSFVAGARLVNAISELADLDDHYPDVDLRYGGVTVRLFITPDCGLSKSDVELTDNF